MSRIHDALKKSGRGKATLAGGVATSAEPNHAVEEPRARKPCLQATAARPCPTCCGSTS